MYFFPDAEIEAILSEDIPYGDLTSLLLGLEGARGAVECFFNLDFSSPGYSKGVQSQHGPLG